MSAALSVAHLAPNLRRARHRRGWSQEMLGHFAGLHATEISRLERGVRDPRLSTVLSIAEALRVPVQDLIAPPGASEDVTT